jgi:hypothetical protein
MATPNSAEDRARELHHRWFTPSAAPPAGVNPMAAYFQSLDTARMIFGVMGEKASQVPDEASVPVLTEGEVVRRARAIRRRLSRDRFRSPRSTDPTNVRCSPHRAASSAWVRPAAARRSRTACPTPSRYRRSSRVMLDADNARR